MYCVNESWSYSGHRGSSRLHREDLCSKMRGDICKIGPRPFKMESQATSQAQEMRCRVRSGGKCRSLVPKSRGEVLR